MQVLTSILKNATGEISMQGCSAMVDTSAQQIGKVLLATEDFDNDNCGPHKTVQEGEEVLASHPVSKREGLKVNDPQRGILVLDETPTSFGDKVNACCVQPSAPPPPAAKQVTIENLSPDEITMEADGVAVVIPAGGSRKVNLQYTLIQTAGKPLPVTYRTTLLNDERAQYVDGVAPVMEQAIADGPLQSVIANVTIVTVDIQS